MKDVESSPQEPVPMQIRNPVTGLMKDVGYGKDYAYAHDFAFSTTDMETFPERLKGRRYYVPGELGLEKEIKKRIDWWLKIKERIKAEKTASVSAAGDFSQKKKPGS
jgi:putative ATPase